MILLYNFILILSSVILICSFSHNSSLFGAIGMNGAVGCVDSLTAFVRWLRFRSRLSEKVAVFWLNVS